MHPLKTNLILRCMYILHKPKKGAIYNLLRIS
jgi:hypothetical protein